MTPLSSMFNKEKNFISESNKAQSHDSAACNSVWGTNKNQLTPVLTRMFFLPPPRRRRVTANNLRAGPRDKNRCPVFSTPKFPRQPEPRGPLSPSSGFSLPLAPVILRGLLFSGRNPTEGPSFLAGRLVIPEGCRSLARLVPLLW